MNPYKDRAIPLISVDQNTGKYVLTTEAIAFLKSVPGPIGVVSVAGLYRTGKSYLLNQMLLNRSSGFGVGPTVNPCTKGLWCWGTPIKGESSQGEKINIIVIDTEGIGALDEDQTHDTRIFTLAILASSCFIYNSVGSIDETAVQNLSLVVNLTKHIQVRTDTNSEEQDPDKIASYFPSFFWVVRDFTLQIVDNEGNKLSSKEYLEKALAPHKGTTMDVEQKNKIRKMLTSFFKERQCFTLVRPVTEENKLQELDKINFEDLRSEFISQVIHFRKRVTQKMKPKTLNGQKLNGELYVSMLSSYVGAINQGAVPNIENAWNYMCQEQCSKVMSEAYEMFEREMKQIKIPCSIKDMNKGIDYAESVAYETFKKKAIGEQSQNYYKELVKRMKTRAEQYRQINAEEGKTAFKKAVTPLIQPIQQKMTQFKSFDQYLEEINKLEEKVNKESFQYVDTALNSQIVFRKLLTQGIMHLSKSMKNEREQIKKALEEKNKLLESENESIKREREAEQTSFREKLVQADKEKIDLKFKIEKLEIDLDKTVKQRNQEGEHLEKNLNAKKAEIQKIRRQYESRINQANNKVEEMNKRLHDEQSNWEKEKAIFELKVRQQVERIEELEKKKQTFDSKLVLQTSELTQRHRQQTEKLQEQIQELMKNWTDSKEKNEELSGKLTEMTDKYTTVSQKFEATEKKLREQSSSKARQIQRIKNQFDCEMNRIKNQLSEKSDETEKSGRDMEERYKKQQNKIKELTEQTKNVKNKYEKQNQLLTQQLDFCRRSLEQSKQKINEIKSIYESRIAAIEQDSGLQRQEQVKRKITELKTTHESEMSNLDREFNEKIKILQYQLENMTKEKNELDLRLKVTEEKMQNERSENEELKQNLTIKNQQLENQIKSIQRERTSELISKEGLFNQRYSILEKQLEDARDEYRLKMSEFETKANQEITQIKNYYEMEREKQEARHIEEKEKLKKNYKKMVQEYDDRIQRENQEHEEQMQNILMEKDSEIKTLESTLNVLNHEKDTLARDKVTIEEKYSVLYAKHNKMQAELTDKLQKLIESSKQEKDVLVAKLEQLQQQKNSMQKQQLSLTHERDLFRNQANKLTAEVEELKILNSSLSERYEETKKTLEERLKEISSNYMRDKSKFETDNALLEQKKNFAESKIVELEGDLKVIREREQEQMRVVREKHQEEMQSITTKYATDKKSLEERIQKIKKTASEAEAGYNRQLSELSKAKAIDEQKIEYLEKKIVETEEKRITETESLSEQLRNLRQKANQQRTQLKTRVEDLEQLLHKREGELSDQKSQYDIQLALADSKIKNLQSYTETTLAEKVDMIRNLERQLDEARRRNENDKSSQQLTHQEIVTRMESKYRGQITQLSQDLAKRNQEIEYLTKEHERIIKDLNEKLAVQKQSRAALDSKILRLEGEYNQRENKLSAEVDRLRTERQALGLEAQKSIAREKENYKNKLTELERRCAEADRLRQQQIYDKEKQVAKWHIERQNLESRIEQFRDQAERENNENKKLIREVEKYRAEKKKNTSYIMAKNNTSTIMAPREVPVENKQNTQMQ